jgi:hypothetical protein
MPLYYALADVALLGGSFAPLGGQNLIEAAACGCPLLMGPHTFNFAGGRDAIGRRRRAATARPGGWSQRPYAFLDDEEPADTVNPSLWRQARLNRTHGLFQVSPRIFQVRGFDIANITFIEGDTGLIALDALTVADTAAAALALYRKHRDPEGRRVLHTVMYSHSHGDHFGGVRGPGDAGRRRRRPGAGDRARRLPARGGGRERDRRRADVPPRAFQFGHTLPKGPRGQVDAGLGKTMPLGRAGLIAPTLSHHPALRDARDRRRDDRIPARARHRGAGRDALLVPAGRRAEPGREHQPHAAQPVPLARLAGARRAGLGQAPARGAAPLGRRHPGRLRAAPLAHLGQRARLHLPGRAARPVPHAARPDGAPDVPRPEGAEIAERLVLPPGVSQRWHNRGYYGTVSHNVKAIVQRYLSWYDAHPANLHALPPVPAAVKTIDYMGGIDAVMQRAQADFERGDYRWVAEVMKHAVYAHPDHAGARELAAQALEQMGFQAESATWRNAFLLGAHEYRNGPPKAQPARAWASAGGRAVQRHGVRRAGDPAQRARAGTLVSRWPGTSPTGTNTGGSSWQRRAACAAAGRRAGGRRVADAGAHHARRAAAAAVAATAGGGHGSAAAGGNGACWRSSSACWTASR